MLRQSHAALAVSETRNGNNYAEWTRSIATHWATLISFCRWLDKAQGFYSLAIASILDAHPAAALFLFCARSPIPLPVSGVFPPRRRLWKIALVRLCLPAEPLHRWRKPRWNLASSRPSAPFLSSSDILLAGRESPDRFDASRVEANCYYRMVTSIHCR